MLKKLLLAAGTLLAFVAPLGAQEYPVQGVAAVEILPGYRTKTGTHMAALRVRLKDGWKTYWRSPGGNGIPPQFRWTGSKNLKGVAFHWPAPGVYVKDGIQTIGFKKELVLPIELMAKDAGKDISLKGRIDFGICSDVCIPATADFAAFLDKDKVQNRHLIQAALKAGPQSARKGGVDSARCTVRPTKDGFTIASVVKMKRGMGAGAITVIEYAQPDVWVDMGDSAVSGKQVQTTADIYSFGDAPLALDRSRLRLTVLDGAKVTEIKGCSG